MEPLSNVRTIMSIAQDILAALETASRNKSRCGRIANRVRRLRDVLSDMDGPESGTTTSDAAIRKGLEETLRRALEQVRRCQRSGFLRSLVIAGGRMADPLDEVEREIDRCLLDLGAASYARIARLEALVLRQLNVAATASTGDVGAGSVLDDKKVDRVPFRSGAKKDEEEDATAAEDVTAIGVPVCTVAVGVHGYGHGHEIVRLPSHGNGCCNCNCYWRSSHGHGKCDCWHYYAGVPSDDASYYTQYRSPYPSIFSDDNPNACSII
ncbi:unnamed protein product [Urochloa humidicola]